MPALPKRPWPYIAGLLLIVMIILTMWMFRALDSEELQRAVATKKQTVGSRDTTSAMPGGEVTPPPAVAPEIREAAAPLNAENGDPQKDLQTLASLLTIYRRIYDGNPVGENSDITRAMLGQNEKRLVAIPPDHPAIRDGQIIDRWGTPYWFHPLSGKEMEIRSAGPDRQMFTADDIVPQ